MKKPLIVIAIALSLTACSIHLTDGHIDRALPKFERLSTPTLTQNPTQARTLTIGFDNKPSELRVSKVTANYLADCEVKVGASFENVYFHRPTYDLPIKFNQNSKDGYTATLYNDALVNENYFKDIKGYTGGVCHWKLYYVDVLAEPIPNRAKMYYGVRIFAHTDKIKMAKGQFNIQHFNAPSDRKKYAYADYIYDKQISAMDKKDVMTMTLKFD